MLLCGLLAAPFDDQLNSVPSIHIRCRMTASFRATATLALRSPFASHAHAPGFESRPLRNTREQHIGCFVEVTSQHPVAAFRDSASPVNLAGCVSSGRQSA